MNVIKKRSIIAGIGMAVLVGFSTSVSASIGTFIGVGDYDKSIYDDLSMAETRAIDEAMEHATGQAGVYVENYTKSEKVEVSVDEMQAIASTKSRMVGTPKLTRTKLPTGTIRIHAEVTTTVDTADIDAMLMAKAEERQQNTMQCRALQQAKEDLDKRIQRVPVPGQGGAPLGGDALGASVQPHGGEVQRDLPRPDAQHHAPRLPPHLLQQHAAVGDATRS